MERMQLPGIPDEILDAFAGFGPGGTWTARDEPITLTVAKGAYALVLRLEEPIRLDRPRTAGTRLTPGWYVYAGSARGPGGIRARLSRHFRREKTLHWHIDQLTVQAADLAALALGGGDECDLVARLSESTALAMAAPGFGSSDCRRCESHLLRFDGVRPTPVVHLGIS
jgi:Uri superfamily endonuclease